MAFTSMYAFILQTILALQIVSVFTETLGLSTEITTKISKKQNSKVFNVITDTKKDWYGALSDCAMKGWNLASIESEEEYQEVLKQINAVENRVTGEDFWLSGITFDHGATFMWGSSGRNVTYYKWHRSHPNYFEGCDKGLFHCIKINSRFNNEWNVDCCDQKKFYICQSRVKRL